MADCRASLDLGIDRAKYLEDKKSALSAMLGTFLILFAAIFFIVLAIRAF